MIPVDFHTHTLFSLCGLHTHIEMLSRARELGMAGLAITDHGPELYGSRSRPVSSFYDRLTQPVPEVRMIKGIEANLKALEGQIDVPVQRLPDLELVLLGIHKNTPGGRDASVYTRAMIAALEQNPCVDMLTHLNPGGSYPVRLREVIRAARARGVVIEVNNAKLHTNQIPTESVRELVRICKEENCRIAIGSDAHAVNEVGRDEQARAILHEESFPDALWVNQTAEKAFAFIEERRENKVAGSKGAKG